MTKVSKKFIIIIGLCSVFLFLESCQSSKYGNKRKKVRKKKLKSAPCGCPKHATYFVKECNVV